MLSSYVTTVPPRASQRRYKPRGAALSLLYAKEPEVILSGPAGTGKSRANLEKLHLCACKYLGMRGLIVRKTRESMSESVLVTFEEKVLPENSPIAWGASRHNRQVYVYPNGSEIVVAGLVANGRDQRAKVMSTEYDIIYVPEAIELTEHEWFQLTTRARNHVMPYQQVIGDCNPDAPVHWLWLRGMRGAVRILHSVHQDNPTLWDGRNWTSEGRAYIARLQSLTGTDYDRLYLGKWVQASGLVYDTWSDPGNVTEEAEYVAGAGPVAWAVDDGYAGMQDSSTGCYTAESHPRVFLLVQQRDDGRLCVFAEHYAVKQREDHHIAAVQALGYEEPDYAVVDKSAATLKRWLHDAGIGTYNGPPTVEESIKELRSAFAPDSNGWRRVLVHPRCKHLRAEMVSYRYDDNGKPLKQFDHGPDALRYLIWHLRYDQ